jgi:hypothetical protein
MLFISIGAALVYLLSMATNSSILYEVLCFDRASILKGQVWRLFSYVFTYDLGNPLITAISLICYYSLGRAMENIWGTLRFTLFYFCGIVMMDIWCMLFGGRADVTYLNLSLFLSYATMYPNVEFLILFIIPVKAWVLGLFDLVLVLFGLFAYPFPENLFSVISLANYFLFFGAGVLNVLPQSWRIKARRTAGRTRSTAQPQHKTIPFDGAPRQSASAKPKAPYTHRCTVCGRTDISDPELEFRYCSRCNGYYCYCQDHISNHTHIE